MNKRNVGNDKEDIVSIFLEKNNIKIIDRNFYTDHGELDIVGMDGEYLVFFEVKYKKNKGYGNPFEMVNYSKRRRIVNASRVYLYKNHYPENTFIRYDVVGVLDGEITWIKQAFDAF